MSQDKPLVQMIIERTLRVPRTGIAIQKNEFSNDLGLGSKEVSRQLDIALISAGFIADNDLLDYIASLDKVHGVTLSKDIINAVKVLTGDHVKHNVYFKDFPNDVPDTVEFWSNLITQTYGEGYEDLWDGNLLELDSYGQYQHSYEEMLQARKPFTEKLKRDFKAIKLGDTLQAEVNNLFLSLAESNVPLNPNDRYLLAYLSELAYKIPESIPIRENKAIINAGYINVNKTLLIDTFTDILRLAAQLSDGDVTLEKPTRYKTFTKRQKKAILNAIQYLPSDKLNEASLYKEQTKRLLTHLHIAKENKVRRLFDIVNSRTITSSVYSRVEHFLAQNYMDAILNELDKYPGLLIRNLNRILMTAQMKDFDKINKSVENAIQKSSMRVILSLRQYLENRNTEKIGRVFINRKGGTYVLQDTLPQLPESILSDLKQIIDNEVKSRMKDSQIEIDDSISHYAIPISDKHRANGLNVVPRGTVSSIDKNAEILRFFVYWKEKRHADYDLSLIMLDENFKFVNQISYTNLRGESVVHSGDITRAPKGASEFIDVDLSEMKAKYLVPQVNIFSGDTFDEAKEAFFGYMLRNKDEMGKPFEAKTVETKSDLYGSERVALPMIFSQDENGWSVKQLNMFLKGNPHFNSTETNASQTEILMQSIMADNYLTMNYLSNKVELIESTEDEPVPTKKITQINIHEVIPE